MSCEHEQLTVGDIGTALIVVFHKSNGDIKDISGATLIQIILTKPTGVTVTNTATLVTDGTDGQAQYIIQSPTDIDVPGFWYIRGYIEEGSSQKHHTTKAKFKVYAS